MVQGLTRFREHFAPYKGNYMLIGGAACMLALNSKGYDFRKTKDLDILLSVEALDSKFMKAFWEFIRGGKYQHQQKSTGKKLFYRFNVPVDTSYPKMIELFSRKPDSISLVKDTHLTPIPADEEVSSLSAILLDDEYYRFIHEGKQEIDGLPTIDAMHLIPMKARAWVNLSALLDADKKDVRKHKNDVISLYQLLNARMRILLPTSIKKDMQKFVEEMKFHSSMRLKDFGLGDIQLGEVLENLTQIYGLQK